MTDKGITPTGAINGGTSGSQKPGIIATRNLRILNSVFEYEGNGSGDTFFGSYSLEDNLNAFTRRHRGNITYDNKGTYLDKSSCKRTFAQFFGANKDVFITSDAKSFLKANGQIHQKDLFQSELNQNNGIQYSKDNEYIQNAINLASADIGAIERGTVIANTQLHNEQKGALEYDDFVSYHHGFGPHDKAIKALNLDDNDTSLTAEEYACYLLAADGLAVFDENDNVVIVDKDKIDGTITHEEALKFASCTDKQVQALAQAIYDYEDFKDYFHKD